MKKLSFLLLFIILTVVGCNSVKDNNETELGMEKAQRIEVLEEPNTVVTVIDGEDIHEFIESLKVEQWESEKIPSGEKQGKIYKLFQEDTKTVINSNKNEEELKEISTIITYETGPYIEFIIKNVSLSFKVPDEVYEYLSTKW